VTGSGGDRAGDVLVLRALGLGDALTGVAALRGVRRAWPDRRLVLAGPPGVGAWLRKLGIVDEVLPAAELEPIQWRPERPAGHIAVNLHGRGPTTHRLLLDTGPDQLVAFRCPEAGHLTGPSWRGDEHEVDRWCRLLMEATGAPCGREDLRLPAPTDAGRGLGDVVLHPGASSGSRRWPVDRWAWLAARLVGLGHRVVLSGGADERELCAAVVDGAVAAGAPRDTAPGDPAIRSTAACLDVAGLAGVVGRARLLVCGDTGVAHLATALGTPSVLLFGPVPPAHWGPAVDADLHRVLWHGDADVLGDPHADHVDPALAAIEPAEVLAAVRDLLEAGSPGRS
jgi:ADP-heptose:LPS heptosyltransferase